MNPYVNSLNGWGGGFIAFWPSQGIEAIETFQGGAREREDLKRPEDLETIGQRYRRLVAEREQAEAQLVAKQEQVREIAQAAKAAEARPRSIEKLFPKVLEHELAARLQQLEIQERLEALKQAEKKVKEQEMLMLMMVLIDE